MHDAKYAKNLQSEKHLNMIFFLKCQQKMNIIQSGIALLFENVNKL